MAHCSSGTGERRNKVIGKYISLLDEDVVVICTDGTIVRGEWIDRLNGEDANEEERQEDSILIQSGEDLIEVYDSEIKSIQINKKE